MSFLVRTKFDGHSPDGRRLYFKGGGGGDAAYYKDLNRLYQEQADSARLLRTQAEANLPGAVDSYVRQVQAITDPSYAGTQAAMAGADMASANAQERASTERSLTSMGVNPNDPRFASSMRGVQVNNAARMAAGKNLARNDAKKFQLAVAQDAVGTFTGQSNSAATQMGGASSGLANLAAQKTAADQNAAAQESANVSNAVGGAMAAWSMFKDGGEVDIVQLADGGELQIPQRLAQRRWSGLARRKAAESTKSAHDEALQTSGGGVGLGEIIGAAMRNVPKALQGVGKIASASQNPGLRSGGRNSPAPAANAEAATAAREETAAADPDNATYHLNSLKDGGPVRTLERHMLGGGAGAQQATQQGFFSQQKVAPPPAMPSPQAPQQGPSMAQTIQTAKKVKEAAGGSKAAAATDKIGRIVGKFSESAGNEIQSQAAGMRMAGDPNQAGAAADAYRAAAAETKDAALSEAYKTSAANIEAGAGMQPAAQVTEAAIKPVGEAAGQALGETVGQAVTEQAGQLATEKAGELATQKVGEAVAGSVMEGAGSTALGSAMGAIGTAMPWIGAAYAVGSLLGAWADGGEIESPKDEFARAWNDDAPADSPTMDGRDGGDVEGPGSHTDDIVPALLSNGEGVLNGEAMALGGKEVMEELNAQGLALRKRGISPDQIRGLRAARMKKEAA